VAPPLNLTTSAGEAHTSLHLDPGAVIAGGEGAKPALHPSLGVEAAGAKEAHTALHSGLGAKAAGAGKAHPAHNPCLSAGVGCAEAAHPVDGFRARAEPGTLQTLCRTLIARGVAVSPGGGAEGSPLLSSSLLRASCMEGRGVAVSKRPLLDPSLLLAAYAEARVEQASGRMAPSRVKSAQPGQPSHYTDNARRGDVIRWLDGAQPSLPALSALTQWLRSELLEAIRDACAHAPAGTNSGAGAAPGLFLERLGGLPPAMLACYPGRGARFERHIDNSPATRDARAVTAVLYLNPGWTPEDGGVLRLYPLFGPCVDVEPVLGALVLFWSHRVEHEVLPAHAPRYALSLWMSVAPDQPLGWLENGYR
jgi:SM-20-related protein